MFQLEVGTLNTVVPFPVKSGDVVTVKSKNGEPITVGQLRLKREDNTYDYWTISGYTERSNTLNNATKGGPFYEKRLLKQKSKNL